MVDAGANRPPPDRTVTVNDSTRNDGFRQAMLKAALDTTPQLKDDNYPVWKDKMSGFLELRGVLNSLESPTTQLTNDENAELKLLLISKMDSVTHNNFINGENQSSAKGIWKSIKECFASAQSSNRARKLQTFLVLQGLINNGLYSVDEPSSVGHVDSSHVTTKVRTLQEIHESFGHASLTRLNSFIPNLLENEYKRLGYCPTWVCSDGGGEFVGNRLVRFLGGKNIRRLISEPYHPEHQQILKDSENHSKDPRIRIRSPYNPRLPPYSMA
ncbi:hypothetical protein VP01_58g8 [Puccinia sorghi]|uniref:Integrase catalytic domain-containing protein n=1 Tax=Puccinia sorghi TaxID=27349 RepID=A0A0L6UJX4_9BASI|nr:hypothetical protein VP01_58g8 [Puccinia sorghi]